MAQVLTPGNDVNPTQTNNYIYALDGDDVIIGPGFSADYAVEWYAGFGNDFLGYSGAQTALLFGDNGYATPHGGTGNDYIYGADGSSLLVGGEFSYALAQTNNVIEAYAGKSSGNDFMKAGYNASALYGLDGNDILIGSDSDDLGTYAYFKNNGVGYFSPIKLGLFGGDGTDYLDGGRGNDYLDGGNGEDTLIGGIGNDQLWGGAGVDRLQGGDGDDYLNGGAGADYLDGGDGNDTYAIGGDKTDTIVDVGGLDTIQAGASLSLAGYAAIERLFLTGTANINGTGNALGNNIRGNAGNNTLRGEAGADSLQGGLGIDQLIGGAGADYFVYKTAADSGAGNADIIFDFQDSGADRIDLRAVSAAELTYQSTGAFTGANQVRVQASGADVIVYVNIDGNTGTSEMQIVLKGTTIGSMAASDFLL